MQEEQEKNGTGVKEIARRAGVSIATVDRVLHNRTGVSPATKAKILTIIKELDYQPNIFARRLSSNKTMSIAVLIPSASAESAFWDLPRQGINKAAAEIAAYGVAIHEFLFDQDEVNTFEEQVSKVLGGDYAAVVLAPMFVDRAQQFLDACDRKKMPCVLINSDLPAHDNRWYYGPDLFQSGKMGGHLLRYLLPKGNILLVNISKELDAHHHLLRKEEGLRAYLSANGLKQDLYKIDIRHTNYSAIAKALDAKREEMPPVDAVFVTNSRVASVARYMEEQQLAEKILIGYDFIPENINYLERGTIDFLICQKPFEQGYRAIKGLCSKLIYDVDMDRVNFMPIDLVTKENLKSYGK